MDAKNLEVLKKLKESMASEPGPAGRPIISSEELLRRLTETHLALIDADNAEAQRIAKIGKKAKERQVSGGNQKPPVTPKAPAGKADVLQRQLKAKCIFRGISVSPAHYKALKEAMANLIYGDDQKLLSRKYEALSLYLSKAPDDSEAKLVFEKLSLLRHPLKKNWPKADKSADTSAPAWVERTCLGCKKMFVNHRDWENPPNRCKECRAKLNSTKVFGGKKKGAKTMYSNFVIYSGGAPGLGKR